MARDHIIDKAVRYVAENRRFSQTKDSDPQLIDAIQYAETLGFLKRDHSKRNPVYLLSEKGQHLFDAEFNHSTISSNNGPIVVTSANTHIGDNYRTNKQIIGEKNDDSYLKRNIWQIMAIVASIVIAVIGWIYF